MRSGSDAAFFRLLADPWPEPLRPFGRCGRVKSIERTRIADLDTQMPGRDRQRGDGIFDIQRRRARLLAELFAFVGRIMARLNAVDGT